MASPTLWGSTFQLNTTTTSSQAHVKLAALRDGSFIAVWTDSSQAPPDISSSSIRGQLLNADGTKKGGEFVINTTTEGAQSRPSVAVLTDGRIVVTWTDASGADGELGSGIRARVFTANGLPLGDDFRVNTNPGLAGQTPAQVDQYSPVVAALANGGFVISYTDDFAGDGSGKGVRAQAFNADLGRLGAEVYVNQTTTGAQAAGSLVGLKDGRYVAFYLDTSRSADDPEQYTVRGRIMNADGTPSAGTNEFIVPSSRGTKQNPQAVLLKDGRFVVVWEHWDTPSVSSTGDGSEIAVKAQIYNADGSMWGGEFLVNTTTYSRQWSPSVTATHDGGFAVAFIDWSQANGSTRHMRVATFNADGLRTGPDMVAGVVHDNIGNSSITTLADGRIVVSWDGTAGASSPEKEVWAQILDPRSRGIELNGTAVSDHHVGTAFNDVLRGAGGNDRLLGEGGNDVIDGGSGQDFLDGGVGDDVLRGADGNDTLMGNVGNDVLDGGTGNDIMNGGAGNDTYHVDSAADAIIDASGIDTVVTTYSRVLESFLENMIAASGSGALSLTGNGFNNVLTGNEADNVLDGEGGADTMLGGAGNDVYHVDNPGDIIVEAANGGADLVYSTVSHVLAAYVENLTASGSASINLTGNTLANVIRGNGGKNKINGGAGNDQLWGGAGKDIFVFDTALNSRTNKDKILDWSYRDDTIHLENKIFKKLTKTGTLKKDYFVLGSKAKDGNDFIGYDKKTGDLWYDANGNKSGGQVVFANIGKNKTIFHTDFVVI